MKLLAKQKQQVAAAKSVTASLLLIALHYQLVLVVGQFRFESSNSRTALTPLSDLSNSSLVWQPLRATFRPLNRPTAPPPPPVPAPPPAPAAPTPPPPPPLPLALSINGDSTFESSFAASNFEQPTGAEVAARAATLSSTTGAPTTASPVVESNEDLDDDQPTRVPLNRFRPTRAPSEDEQSQPSSANSAFAAASGSQQPPVLQPPPPAAASSPASSTPSTSLNQSNNNNNTNYRISAECFECICEASTSCNPNSRCQTSDVRHTRCGLYLISYDQWLETGLSKQLVTREALARDAAADERAFYECVTGRDCAERLLEIYLQRKGRDCDRDGRVDCYDLAAIHQAGAEQCAGESLLESQYWSDFNACFGFGRRRR